MQHLFSTDRLVDLYVHYSNNKGQITAMRKQLPIGSKYLYTTEKSFQSMNFRKFILLTNSLFYFFPFFIVFMNSTKENERFIIYQTRNGFFREQKILLPSSCAYLFTSKEPVFSKNLVICIIFKSMNGFFIFSFIHIPSI